MPTDQLDLKGSLNGQVTVTPEEHPDDRALRLENERRTAQIQAWQGVAVFATLLLLLIAITVISAYKGLFDAGASAETQRWAQTILSAVVAGTVSFFVGRKIGSK